MAAIGSRAGADGCDWLFDSRLFTFKHGIELAGLNTHALSRCPHLFGGRRELNSPLVEWLNRGLMSGVQVGALSQGTPARSQGNPSLSQGTPALNQGSPAPSQGTPALSQGTLGAGRCVGAGAGAGGPARHAAGGGRRPGTGAA
eukprot:1178522-Prorocentrum_minimum.AAC.7